MTSKKHRPWARALSQHWQTVGILETCEVRFTGCFGNYGLAPAHSKDRRDIHSREDFFEVVAACEHCHFILDRKMNKAARLTKVKEIIANRADVVAA